MSVNGNDWKWSCFSCSFRNNADSQRCSMCSSLRNTSKDNTMMIDLSNNNEMTSTSSSRLESDSHTRGPLHQQSSNLSQKIHFANPYKRSSTSTGITRNPYASSGPIQKNSYDVKNNNNQSKFTVDCTLKDSNDELRKTKDLTQKQILKNTHLPSDPFSHTESKVLAAQATKERIKYVSGPVALDEVTCKDWIYPTNYPVRDYQLEISNRALFENTLVSLPTGLGKTLIAAVIMYNYYRWFPKGKVVFCAPTRPLVTQQIKACYDIMGIPAKHTAEISGRIEVSIRRLLWAQHRVFFCTPQTLEHDIQNGSCDASKIVCIVLDEAHKARGDYAYCKVIEEIERRGARFRVLGLSATPGTNIAAIQEVIENLRIGQISVRFETDHDVKKYIHEKQTEVIVVKQSSAINVIERLMSQLIQPLIDNLRSKNALTHGTASTLHPYTIQRAKEAYHQARNDRMMDGVFHAAHKLLTIKQNLRTHGVGIAKTQLFNVKCSPSGLLRSIVKRKEFEDILDAIDEACSAGGNYRSKHQSLKDQKEEALNLKLNNPKLEKLCEILVDHFQNEKNNGNSTRAIVFSQWRKSVEEIVSVLSTERILKPRKFVGQGKTTASGNDQNHIANDTGMKQSEQEEAIREFTDGIFNVLVCTSIGEEGLDIGQVDLIVSFDCVASATRMIQRNGRTGRKRDGRVVLLVSEGSEEQKHKKSQSTSKTLNAALKNPSSFVMRKSPSLFPLDCFPLLTKREIVLSQEYRISQIGGYRNNKNTRKNNLQETLRESFEWKLCPEEEDVRRKKYGAISPKITESEFMVLQLASDGDSYRTLFPRSLRRKYIKSIQCRTKKKKGYNLGRTSSIFSALKKHGYVIKRSDEAGECVKLSFSNVPDPEHIERTSLSQGIADIGILDNIDDIYYCHKDMTDNLSCNNNDYSDPTVNQKNEQYNTAQNAIISNQYEKSDEERDKLKIIFGSCSIRSPLKRLSANIDLFEDIQDGDLTKVAAPKDEILTTTTILLPNTLMTDCEFVINGVSEGDCSPERSFSSNLINRAGSEIDGRTLSNDETFFKKNKENCYAYNGLATWGTRSRGIETEEKLIDGDIETNSNIILPPQGSSSDFDYGEIRHENPETKSDKMCLILSPDKVTNAIDCAISEYFENSNDMNVMNFEEFTYKVAVFLSCDVSKLKQDHLILINDKFSELIGPRMVHPQEIPVQTHMKSKMDSRIEHITSSNNDSKQANKKDSDKSFLNNDKCKQTLSESMNDMILLDRCKKSKRQKPILLSSTPDRSEEYKLTCEQKLSDHLTNDDEDICRVCRGYVSSTSDPIVFCDGCNLAVHLSCYSINIPIEDDVPWYCEVCSLNITEENRKPAKETPICGICKQSDGALKRTEPPEMLWVHPVCVWWTPEFEGRSEKLGTLANLRQKEPERESLRCMLCKVVGGAVQCCVSRCLHAAHPHCAMNAPQSKQWMLFSYDDNMGNCKWPMFCHHHLDKAVRLIEKEGISKEETFGVQFNCKSLYENERKDCLCDDSDDENFTNNRSAFQRLKPKAVLQQKRTHKSPAKRNEYNFRSVSKLSRLKRRRQLEVSLLDVEANINSDEDVDGDEGEFETLRMIEDEELENSSFINDSSQLGSYRDSLDQINESFQSCATYDDSNDLHRKIDNERERAAVYSTPVLNRRGLNKDMGTFSDLSTNEDSRSPLKGLGNMHFIRSVLDHHRQGGNDDQIEAEYDAIAAQGDAYSCLDDSTDNIGLSEKEPKDSVNDSKGNNNVSTNRNVSHEVIDMTTDSVHIPHPQLLPSEKKLSFQRTNSFGESETFKINKDQPTNKYREIKSSDSDHHSTSNIEQFQKPQSGRVFQSNRSWDDINSKALNASLPKRRLKSNFNQPESSIIMSKSRERNHPSNQVYCSNHQHLQAKLGNSRYVNTNNSNPKSSNTYSKQNATTSMKGNSIQVTEEMRVRAEANRKRALEIQEEKRKKLLQI